MIPQGSDESALPSGRENLAPDPRSSARKQVPLRLDPAVHAAIAKWASDDLRSVNAQIEVLLRRALADAGRDPGAKPMRPRGRPRKSSVTEALETPGSAEA